MPLPIVQGWMIDYRTASAIFASQSNAKIAHCVSLCQTSRLFISHREESRFKADDLLADPFINETNCVFECDDDIYDRCHIISQNPNGKSLLTGKDTAIYLTATAVSKNFGVISDHTSPRFATVHDLCHTFGVPVYTADQYFALI